MSEEEAPRSSTSGIVTGGIVVLVKANKSQVSAPKP